MKLTVCVHRKCGAPGYGSDGAGAELVVEVPDGDPNAVLTAGNAWYAVLDKLVGGQVDRMQAAHLVQEVGRSAPAAIAPPQQTFVTPPPGPPAVAGGAPGGYPPPPTPSPAPAAPQGGGGGRSDAPRNGKQLLGWANKAGKYDELMALAKNWNRGKVVTWSEEDVVHAYRHLARPAAQTWGG